MEFHLALVLVAISFFKKAQTDSEITKYITAVTAIVLLCLSLRKSLRKYLRRFKILSLLRYGTLYDCELKPLFFVEGSKESRLRPSTYRFAFDNDEGMRVSRTHKTFYPQELQGQTKGKALYLKSRAWVDAILLDDVIPNDMLLIEDDRVRVRSGLCPSIYNFILTPMTVGAFGLLMRTIFNAIMKV